MNFMLLQIILSSSQQAFYPDCPVYTLILLSSPAATLPPSTLILYSAPPVRICCLDTLE